MKAVWIILLLIVLSPLAWSSPSNLTPNEVKALHLDIEKMYAEFESGDVSLFLSKAHSSIYKITGGKENYHRLMSKAVLDLKSQGIEILSADIGVYGEFLI